ncbi:Rna polymerase iii transcription repressor [Globisporangium polare]
MKYLEENALTWLNSVLGSYEIGDRVLCSKIEAYSCKKAGSDKKLAKNLELYYQQELEALSASKDLLSSSPLGPLTSAATRKLLINLISTMNASFPDYDFSTVKPEQFCKELDYRLAIQRINHDLAELIDAESNGFVEKMWEAIAETIKLDECEVYSYIPDMDSDPFSDGTLWSFNYFFYNRNQKKILYFTCMSKGLAYDDDLDDDEMMEDSEMFDEDADESVEDYFGMSPDWEDGA